MANLSLGLSDLNVFDIVEHLTGLINYCKKKKNVNYNIGTDGDHKHNQDSYSSIDYLDTIDDRR